MKAIIVDLDGTLSDASHRADLAQAKKWDGFHEAGQYDTVVEGVAKMAICCLEKFSVIIVTGRNEKYRKQTMEWLYKNNLAFDEILMRPDDDYRGDVEMKLSLIEDYFGGKEEALKEVLFCLDDRDRVVEGFRDYGLKCWQVKQGDY